jgi:plastocyanin
VRRVLLVAIGAAAFAVAPAVTEAAHKPPVTKKVTVGDDYFTPVKTTVKPGTTVLWKWLGVNSNTHDVKLKKGPRGVKKFHSDPAAAYFSYKRKLTVKGKYSIICTFHQDMVQTSTVR